MGNLEVRDLRTCKKSKTLFQKRNQTILAFQFLQRNQTILAFQFLQQRANSFLIFNLAWIFWISAPVLHGAERGEEVGGSLAGASEGG
jgi:hypothetical protein